METQNITDEIRGSLETILKFSGLDEEFCSSFRDAVTAYKKLSDKNGSDDQAAGLRRKLTDLFYKVYKACFVLSVRNKTLPPVISMFLNFGYVDEELAGEEMRRTCMSLRERFPRIRSGGYTRSISG